MDRTGKFVVSIAIMILIGWMYYTTVINPPPAPAAASPSPSPAGATAQTGTSAPGVATVSTANPTPTPEPELPEQKQQAKSPAVDFTFTSHGGGIAQAQLNNHLVDLDSGKHILLNEYGPVPIGAISELPNGTGDTASYTAVPDAPGVIAYQRTTPDQLQITKKFTLPTGTEGVDQYIATLDLSITNRGSKPYKSDGYYIHLGSAAPIHSKDTTRYICMDWYLGGKDKQINITTFNAGKFLGFFETHPERPEYTDTGDGIAWAGVYSQYLTIIATPINGDGGNRIWARHIPLDLDTHQSGTEWTNNNPPGAVAPMYAIDGALGMPGFSLAPGDTHSQQFKIYLGPRQYQLLKHLEQGQDAITHLGYTAFVSKILLKLLIWIHKVVGSYGAAIIVLTIAMKLCMWPLQNRSTQSMKKMQVLSPKIKEMQEKYKDDPAKLNTETIKLYKTYGVNPVAGCLPMFIQFPIFIGFYSMLGSSIELRNSTFFWVHDLTQPDTVGHILGYAINLLPLCMAASSLWMTLIMPKSGDSSQQRIMYFTPLMFLLFCYNYASGLALYLMVSNLFSVAQLYLTRNQTAPTLEKLMAGRKKR